MGKTYSAKEVADHKKADSAWVIGQSFSLARGRALFMRYASLVRDEYADEIVGDGTVDGGVYDVTGFLVRVTPCR